MSSKCNYIDSSAFKLCYSLESVGDVSSVTFVGDHAFSYDSKFGPSLLLSKIETIDTYAFEICALKYITLGESCITLNNNCFQKNQNLIWVKCLAIIPPTCGTNIFTSTNDTFSIYVPLS